MLEAQFKLKMDQQVLCPEMAKIRLRNESLVKDFVLTCTQFGVRLYVHFLVFVGIFCASSQKNP